MRTLISSAIGAALLAAFAALGSGLISGVYEQTKAPIAAAERAAEAKQLLEIFPDTSHDNQLIDDTIMLNANDPLLGLRAPVSAIVRASGLKLQGSSSPRPLATVTAVTFVYWSVSIEQVQWRVFAC